VTYRRDSLLDQLRARTPTLRQRMILDWIADFASVHGCSPSVREIGRAFGVRPNCVVGHLHALERKGCIHRHRGLVRGIVVVETGTERSR